MTTRQLIRLIGLSLFIPALPVFGVAGDPIVGTFRGPVTCKSGNTEIPEIKLVFSGNGTFTWAMQGDWRAYWYGVWARFPALSGSGTYNYSRSTGKTSCLGSWTGLGSATRKRSLVRPTPK